MSIQMPNLIILQFTVHDGSDSEIVWHAFSSTDAARTKKRLFYDAYYSIGFQISHPEDKETDYGFLDKDYAYNSPLTLAERAQGLQFVFLNNTINTTFTIIPMNQQYTDLTDEHGSIQYAQHHEISPNNLLVIPQNSESDSDTDSD